MPPLPEAVSVRLTVDSGLLRMEVLDGSAQPPQCRTPKESDTHGRGLLLLLDVLSDGCGVDALTRGGKVILALHLATSTAI